MKKTFITLAVFTATLFAQSAAFAGAPQIEACLSYTTLKTFNPDSSTCQQQNSALPGIIVYKCHISTYDVMASFQGQPNEDNLKNLSTIFHNITGPADNCFYAPYTTMPNVFSYYSGRS